MAEHQQRMRIITMISLAAALLILGRYAVLMLSPNRENPDPPPSPARTERGSIVDRNGRLVAMQTRLWSVTAWLPDVEDTAVTASLLAPLIDEDADELSRKMTNARSRFLYVKRQIPPSQSDAVKRLISEGKLPGIGLQEELGRHYPMKELGASVVGYVGTDNVGLAGIEYAFDRELSPQGIVTGDSILRGNTVHLTLDMDTQYLVDRIAQEAWEEHQPDSLMVLVMDATNGALRSWTSLPQFDPNTFGSFSGEERMNRPLVEAYEPGSVFKIFSWSALLDAGVVQPEERFDTTGGYAPEIFQKYDIAPITDLGAYGTLDVTGALVRSSNVAVAMATERRDKNAFYSDLKNFGFGVPTGIPLTGESNGILYAPSR
ncbi:MAG: peptidoglycan glycosyltransferase, partial [Spirochaetales bacterium]|nr:peptidoglycan glycosyltransferase [Spirochaetales bacterium]